MAKANLKKKLQFWGTGRRKKAIARVRLVPAGTGVIEINERAFEDYFPQGVLQYVVKQPLTLLGVESKYDVLVNVYGGGYTGQANAIRLGIARALLQAEEGCRPALKKEGFLTRTHPVRNSFVPFDNFRHYVGNVLCFFRSGRTGFGRTGRRGFFRIVPVVFNRKSFQCLNYVQ